MESIRYNPNPPDEDLSRYVYDEFQRIREELEEIHYSFIVPDSITVNVGGTPIGTVTDVQTLHDGNVYQLPETTGTPGFDIDFNFSNVESISGFVSHVNYAGTSSHNVVLRAYDYSNTADDDYLYIPNSSVYSYRTVLIPDGKKYVDRGSAQLSLYHVTAGNASHDIYIDYIAILGKRRARY